MSSFEREYRDSVTRSFNRGIQIEQLKEDLKKEFIFRTILTNGREKHDYFKLYSYTETAVKMLIDEVVNHYMHVFKNSMRDFRLSSRRYAYIDQVVSSFLFDQEYPEKNSENE